MHSYKAEPKMHQNSLSFFFLNPWPLTLTLDVPVPGPVDTGAASSSGCVYGGCREKKTAKTFQFIFMSPLLQSLGCCVQHRELSGTDPNPFMPCLRSFTAISRAFRSFLRVLWAEECCKFNRLWFYLSSKVRLVSNEKSMQKGAFHNMCFTWNDPLTL